MVFSSALNKLWRHIGRRRQVQLGLLTLLMMCSSLAEVFSIGAVLPFLGAIASPDRMFESDALKPFVRFLGITTPTQLLEPMTLIFIGGVVVSAVMRMSLIFVQTRLGFSIGIDLSTKIYRKVLYQNYQVHIERSTSEIISGITDKVSATTYGIIIPLMTMIGTAFILVSVLAVLLFINIRVTLLTFLGFGIIYYLILYFTKNKLKNVGAEINQRQAQLLKTLQESLGSIKDILISGTQEAYCQRYLTAETSLKLAQANVQIFSGIPRYGVEAFGLVLLGIAALILVKQTGITGYFLPMLGAIALGAQRLLPMMQQSYACWTYVRASQASFYDAVALLDQEMPHYFQQKVKPLAFKHDITVSNLSFRYKNDLPLILKSINLTIKKGARVGFIGETGSGKSTLLNTIIGLLAPTSGAIEVDGIGLNNENLQNWQCHIAYVPQEVYLTDRSIRENISLGVFSDDVDRERIEIAADMAQLTGVIDLLPEKFNTLVGEGGIKLSGGQRQRIGIARALYKKADVIVFDEATSALDADTEQSVIAAIESLSKELTIIMVAHRLSTLRCCDIIFEVREGEIWQKGTYAAILASLDSTSG